MAKKKQKDIDAKEDPFTSENDLDSKPVSRWSVEDVGFWITTCKVLQESSSFTEGELEGIAEKFKHAKVDGTAFLSLALDPPNLVKYVGLAIGEALHFSAAMEMLRDNHSIEFDEETAPANPDKTEQPKFSTSFAVKGVQNKDSFS